MAEAQRQGWDGQGEYALTAADCDAIVEDVRKVVGRMPTCRQGVIIMSDRDDPLWALVAGITRDEAQRLASDIVGRIAFGPAAPRPTVTRTATTTHVIWLDGAMDDVGRDEQHRCACTADGWTCTRPAGHGGSHVATREPHTTLASVCAVWED